MTSSGLHLHPFLCPLATNLVLALISKHAAGGVQCSNREDNAGAVATERGTAGIDGAALEKRHLERDQHSSGASAPQGKRGRVRRCARVAGSSEFRGDKLRGRSAGIRRG